LVVPPFSYLSGVLNLRNWLHTFKKDSTMGYFRRLFWFNSVLVFITTIIPLALYQNYFISEYDREINALNYQTVQQIAFTIDQQYVRETLETVSRYFTEIESNEAIVYPLLNNIKDNSSRIVAASTRIKEIATSLDFVEGIDVYYVNNDMYFANGHGCSIFVEGCLTDNRKKIVEFNKQVEWIAPRKLKELNGRNVISYVRGIPYFTPSDRRQAVVAIHINEEFLRNKLEQIKPQSSGQLVIINKWGQIMTSNGEMREDFRKQFIEIYQSLSSETGTPEKTINILGSKHVWSSSPSTINDWTYVSVVSVDQLYKNSNAIRNYLLSIGAFLLLVNFTVAFYITRKAQQPIVSLVKSYSMRIAGLQETIDHNRPVLKQHILSSLISGEAINNPSIKKEQELLGMAFHYPNAISFLLHIGVRDELDYEYIIVQDFDITEIINGRHLFMDSYAIRHKDGLVKGILNYGNEANPQELFESFAEQIEKVLVAPFTLCTGASHDDGIHGYARSFLEAEVAKQYVFLYPNVTLLQYGQLRIAERVLTSVELPFIEQYEDALHKGNTMELDSILIELQRQLIGGLYTVEAVKNWLDETALAIASIFKKADTPELILGYSYMEYYKQLTDVMLVMQWFKDIANAYMNYVKVKQARSNNDFDNKIRSFIKNNVFDQISLELLADHVGMSPTYLSKVFKDYMGQTFTDYVTDLKMEHAVQLILEKKLNIQEISTKLGYNSTHYFIKRFRERYGVTPKQYQKLH
jgi:two-component system response regulator YesN